MRVLPNTAGCRTVKEAVTTAQMAREVFATDWVKLEVIANDDTLQPDVFGLVEAAASSTRDGFKVLPYTTEDLSVAERLLAAGCQVLMPWGAPIGSGRGLANPYALQEPARLFPRRAADHRRRHRRALACGRRRWRWATTACCSTRRSPRPATRCAWRDAFAKAIEAGRAAYEAGLMGMRDMAQPSTPVAGTPFFDLGTPEAPAMSEAPRARARRLLSDRARCRLARAPRAARRAHACSSGSRMPPRDEVRRQIAASLAVARRHGCQLIVNDYWREAIEAGADYVHLGQEDLAAADLAAIKAAGMRLGISTHSEEELDDRARRGAGLRGARARSTRRSSRR